MIEIATPDAEMDIPKHVMETVVEFLTVLTPNDTEYLLVLKHGENVSVMSNMEQEVAGTICLNILDKAGFKTKVVSETQFGSDNPTAN